MLPTGENINLSINSTCQVVQSTNTTAGSGNFSGNFPSGAVTTSYGQFIFAQDVEQGLIDPLALGITNPLRVARVDIIVANTSTWSLNLINTVGASTTTQVLQSGTTSGFSGEAVEFLFPGQKLQLITTGAGTTAVKWVVTLADPNQSWAKT